MDAEAGKGTGKPAISYKALRVLICITIWRAIWQCASQAFCLKISLQSLVPEETVIQVYRAVCTQCCLSSICEFSGIQTWLPIYSVDSSFLIPQRHCQISEESLVLSATLGSYPAEHCLHPGSDWTTGRGIACPFLLPHHIISDSCPFQSLGMGEGMEGRANALVHKDNYWCLLHGRYPDASQRPRVRAPGGSVLPQSWPPKVHSAGSYCWGPEDQPSCVCTSGRAQAWPPFLSLISVQPSFPLPHLAWGTDHQGLKSYDGGMKYHCPLVTCLSSFTYLSGFRSLQPDKKLTMPASTPIPIQSKW